VRIDALASFAEGSSADSLGAILKRNRFEGALVSPLSGGPDELENLVRLRTLHPWMLGIIAPWPHVVPGTVAVRGGGRAAVESGLPCEIAVRDLDLAANYPRVDFVVDELTGPEPLLELPNVAVKITGLTSVAAAAQVRRLLEAVGPGRIMFASGWPRCKPEGTWKLTLASFTQCIGAQTLETREQLLGGTAARVYRLTEISLK